MSKRLLIWCVVSALLAGCGGGGGGAVSPSASGAVASSSTPSPSSGASKAPTEQIAIHLKINPSATTSSNKRHAQFVSPATNGVLVQVYTSPKSANPIPIGTSATDVSPGSVACGGATGTRTCTIYIPAPAGTDDFVFTTYDQPPTPGTTTFPAGANILSIGVVTQTITLAGTNTVNAALGGVITSLSVMPLTQSAVGGGVSSYTLAITAFDADGNAIVSGSTDPYNNPITVAAGESGGSGFTSLTLGGPSGTGSSSVTVAQSSQPVTVLYSGGGAAGYGAQFTVSSSGVPTVYASFAPFFVTSTSPYYATSALSFSAPGQTATVNLSEYGFGGTFTATAGSSCANVATVSVPAAGATSSATVTAGVNAGSCTVTFGDGTVSVPVTVSAQYTSSTITIPASRAASSVVFAITPNSAQGPSSTTATLSIVAQNAGGNTISGSTAFTTPIAVTDNDTTGGISLSATSFVHPTDTITVTYSGAAATQSTQFTTTSVTSVTPVTLHVTPPHQSLYVPDASSIFVFAPGANGNVAPIRVITGANTALSNPHAVALDAAGDMWVTNYNGSITEYAPDANGTAAPLRTIAGNATGLTGNLEPWGIALDAAGNIWILMYNSSTFTGGAIEEFAAGAQGNVAPIAVIQGSDTGDANSVLVDPSGNIYIGSTAPEGIFQFAPGSNGNVAPVAAIAGTNTGFGAQILMQMAFDTSGRLWSSVLFQPAGTSGQVVTFAPNTNGNIAPTTTIGGSATNLPALRGLAFDAQNEMYVSNQMSVPLSTPGSIVVFAAGASGNVAPIRTITGANTLLSLPRFITISP